MKAIKNIFDKYKPQFEKGGKLEKYHPVFETFETLFFVPNLTTRPKGTQIKDAVDLKRMMMTVIIAMLPCLLFGIWNTGYQHFLALGEEATIGDQLLIGLQKVLPIVVASYATGLFIEFIFGIKKGHSLNEGFLVTGMLIPLVVPVTIPIWQVVLATAFAVLIGKAPLVERLCGSLRVDIAKNRELLGWRAPQSPEEGLRSAVGAAVEGGTDA